MSEGEGIAVPKKDDEAHQSEAWTVREFGGKTVWDWMQLLIVPFILSLITVVFSWQQSIRQQGIESKRAEAEQALAEQRAQDEALQAYLDQMGTLLLQGNLLRADYPASDIRGEGQEPRILARARTLTVLGRLDPERKRSVVQFLSEAYLIQADPDKFPLISLMGADLSGADLSDASLWGAALSGADLSGADLSGADLSGADLTSANLTDTNLLNADLSGDDPVENFSGANLSGADLSGAKGWTEEQFSAAESLQGATMPDGQKYEEWLKDR